MLWEHGRKQACKRAAVAQSNGVDGVKSGKKPLMIKKDTRRQFEAALDNFCNTQQMEAEQEPGPQHVPVLRGFELVERLMDILNQLPAADPAWICGGFPRWLCSPRDTPALPADVDVMPATEDAFKLCIQLFIEAGWACRREYYMDDQAVVCNLMGPFDVQGTPLQKVQIIRPRRTAFAVIGALIAPDQLSGLDFTVTRIVLVSSTQALADSQFLRDELQMRIVVRHIVCPISSCARISKYESKGYTIQARERVKLFVEWSRRAVEEPPNELAMMPTKILRMFNDISASDETLSVANFYRALAMD